VRGKLRLGGQDQRVAFSAGREKIESLLFKELLSPKPFDVLLAAQPPPIARAIRARKVLGTMNARQIKMALGRPRRVLTPKKSAWGQPVLLLEYGTHRSEIGDQVLEPGPNFVLDRAGEAILARFGDEEYARAKELRSALFDAYRRYPVVSLDFARKALRLHVWWVNEREVSAERVGAVRAELLRRAKKRYKGRMERFDVTFSRVIPPGGHR